MTTHPDLPPLLAGVAVAAYWLRVLRMAYKARRRSGRAANLIPRERAGRWLRLVWAPVVVLWIVLPLKAGLAPASVRLLYNLPPLRWLGTAGVVVALLLTRACWRAMGRSWRMGIDPGERTPLVTAGPWRLVRHPIYTLSMAMMAATVLACPMPAMVGVGIVHVTLLYWEAVREERHLIQVHGDAYRDYAGRAGRFLPFA